MPKILKINLLAFYYKQRVTDSKLYNVQLKEMGILDRLTCLLRILYMSQEATVRTVFGTTDWFKIEKGVWQGCSLSPCLLNLWEHIMGNARMDELQFGIKIAGRSINNLRYADNISLMAKNKGELGAPWWGWKMSENIGLKLSIKNKNKKLRSWHPALSLHGKQKGKRWKQ